MMKYLLPILFAALIACSPLQQINTEIPQKTIERHPNINSQDATAAINISRKESFAGSSTYYWVSLDTITVMALRSGDYTTFRIQPGSYQLAVHCYGDNVWHSKVVDITIQKAGAQYFKVEPSFSDYCGISAVSEEEFLKDYKNPENVKFGAVPDPDR
jgi:hypothetical protein